MTALDRRRFLALTAAMPLALPARRASGLAPRPPVAPAAPVVISSANGLEAVRRAREEIERGADPADAVVAGVQLVEDDPEDMSVGYGGLPNEDGVVQLDASVMHGPTHKAGAVAALENVRHAARVALHVLRETDHVLLVGAGALAFARALGFREEDLLTEKSRAAWLRWKRNLAPHDDRLDDDQRIEPGAREAVPHTEGTIHCAAVDARGDLAACTTTSGLSFKLPGRAGDSPIVGAGMFVQNDVGAAGATGRGEAVLQSCGAFQTVQHMAAGLDPTEACLRTLRYIADHTKRRLLLDAQGRPDFEVRLYALRKDGACGSACLRRGGKFAVHDGAGARLEDEAFLFE